MRRLPQVLSTRSLSFTVIPHWHKTRYGSPPWFLSRVLSGHLCSATPHGSEVYAYNTSTICTLVSECSSELGSRPPACLPVSYVCVGTSVHGVPTDASFEPRPRVNALPIPTRPTMLFSATTYGSLAVTIFG